MGKGVKTRLIAITGSAGKTSIATLLTQIINLFGKKAVTVGNIGSPMLDILSTQQNYDYIVLELSSFQLEYAKTFAPDISAITNIFPNHLDRHITMQAYLAAKGKLLKNQTEKQISFMLMEYIEDLWPLIGRQKVLWIGQTTYKDIIKELSDITCAQNWQIILSIVEYLGFDVEKIVSFKNQLRIPEHRIEFVRSISGIDFYNDSKSTMPESTLQAIDRFSTRPIIIFLGGLSKGANRHEMIKKFPKNIKHVICFGVEAETLNTFCQKEIFKSSVHATLEESFKKAVSIAKSHDVVLFSPAGSSYDLFKNYEERGKMFKNLVHQLS